MAKFIALFSNKSYLIVGLFYSSDRLAVGLSVPLTIVRTSFELGHGNTEIALVCIGDLVLVGLRVELDPVGAGLEDIGDVLVVVARDLREKHCRRRHYAIRVFVGS